MNAAGGFTAADSFRLWLGDASTSTAYGTYLYNGTLWSSDTGKDVGGSRIFDAYHAAYIISGGGDPSWLEPVPWAP